ncbi:MAG: adenylyl-sulfate kinase [Bacteroidales bacterium]|nr:adenylyl-sulfate kinase [Bacteroidales bacterium]
MLVWMDEKPMNPYTRFYIKQTTNNTKARIDKIRYRVDVNTLERSETDHFKLNEIGRVVITTVKPLFFDNYKKNHNTGSFVLIDPLSHNTVAVGMIMDKLSIEDLPSRITPDPDSYRDDMEKIVKGIGLITKKEYGKRYKQKGATIWITGLHGSGKNELAYTLQRNLFDMGATVVLLDGKSVRAGLSRELDYSPADRAEHLRRVAHLCKLLNEQGIITICSFISPKESIRQQVAEIIGEKRFNLVYLKADIDFCRKNDNYGLYEKADRGEIKYLAGVGMEYEEPVKANIIVNAKENGKNPEKIIEYLSKNKFFPIK